MKNILKSFFYSKLFSNFFIIDLTNSEKNTAIDSLENKYVVGLFQSLILGLLAFPAIIFIDVTILVSVLIPITMVSGTAWFAVSLVNIKKKFEDFGNELTKDLYRSFCTSLVLLALISLVSLNSSLFSSLATNYTNNITLIVSGLLGTFVVFKMIFDVFAGATKYDMNDSMLTGQNEAADKYFKRSLSLLNSCATNLKQNSSNIGTSAYYLGLAFYEIFNYVKLTRGSSADLVSVLNDVDNLKSNPPANLEQIRVTAINLIESFIQSITNSSESNTQKSLNNIKMELSSLRNNNGEVLELINLRLATILNEAEDMLISQGEALFTKRIEIERKFLVNKVPNLKDIKSVKIEQGYLVIDKQEEERIRRVGDRYYHTIKKTFDTGYREETEKEITKEIFESLWVKTDGHRISKTRYLIPYLNDVTIELDIFEGNNKGLILAEVEFKSENNADEFVKPKWFGEDVTDDKKYKNANLAK